jgi:hypothetical protein
MYYVSKEIDKSATIIEQNIVNYTQNLTTASSGIETKKIVSGSISQSYWESLNVLFYSSGSPKYPNEHKFAAYKNTLAQSNFLQHRDKFHGYLSSSLISIPSTYYGEKIKEGSFTYTDKSYTDNAGNNPIIKDDGFGNLYSTNAHHSQSANVLEELSGDALNQINATDSSSIDNYVGNIFYDQGMIVLTETASWSGSVNYSDFGTNYTLQFDSYNSITTYEYSVAMNPSEFNHTMNYSLREPLSGSYSTMEEFTASLLSTQYMAREFTSSIFSPYITEINLYQPNEIEPVIKAKFPRPIKKSKKLTTTFKIRLDL